MGARIRSLNSFPALLASALAAQLMVLWPVVDTAYWGDDTANAYISGYLRVIGQHWWPFIVTANKIQWQGFGRLMPLGVLQTYGAFYVLGDRFAYKVLLIVLTLIASGMIALLIMRLGGSPALSALSAGLPAVVWQFHLLHDPLISYVGLMQTVTIYVTGAMLMFLAWLRHGGVWRAGVVMLLTACACATYESSYLLVAAFVLIAWRERGCALWRAIVLALPALAVSGAFIVVAAVRTLSLPTTSGYHPSFSPGVVLGAWSKIIVSGLPLVGRTAHPGPTTVPAASWAEPVARGALVALLLLPLLVAAARSATGRRRIDRRLILAITGVAAVLMLGPSLLTAVAPEYQRLVQWGWGYLPMLFVALGWALLGALAVVALLARVAGRPIAAIVATLAMAVALGAVAAINSNANARVVDYMLPSARSRDLLEASLRDGVLDRVPTFSTVLWFLPEVVEPVGAWDPGEMDLDAWTRQFVNRPLTMNLIGTSFPTADVCTNSFDSVVPCRVLRTPTFWLRTHVSPSLGFVAIARVGLPIWHASDDTLTAPSRPGSQPVVFVQGARIGLHSLPFAVTVTRPRSSAAVVVPSSRLRVLRRGSGWVLAQLPPQSPFVAFSINVTPTP
ncbi:MAG: hypothetical protein ACRDMX_11350 [Solirubrobacteraceae bacterium]